MQLNATGAVVTDIGGGDLDIGEKGITIWEKIGALVYIFNVVFGLIFKLLHKLWRRVETIQDIL